MKKLTILFFLLLPLFLIAQQKVEIGGFAGFANYQGDLAPDVIELSETKITFGGFLRYHINNNVKVRAGAYLGFISGSDANDEGGSLQSRGWSFESQLFEVSLIGEYHPFGKSRAGETGVFQRQVSPYVFGGVGFVNADPVVTVSLTADEGLFPEQDFEALHLVAPFGLGVRADLVEFLSFGIEGGYRITNDDYLDGVKNTGNPDGRDLYVFIGATVSFFFGELAAYGF